MEKLKLATYPVYLDHCSLPKHLGGKGAGLKWLMQNNFSVPAWFAVSADALLLELGLGVNTSKEDILSAKFNVKFLDSLDQRCGKFSSHYQQKLIVRSSFGLEDGQEASFAGQFLSVLGPKTSGEVADALKRCLASRFSDNVIAYEAQMGTRQQDLPMGSILIQILVNPDASGVCFSANPNNGNRRQAVVAACPGLCEPLVQGEITPDEFVFGDSETAIETRNGDYQSKLIIGQTQLESIKIHRESSCISETQAYEVACHVRTMRNLKSAQYDCEWVITNKQLLFVQARPITTLVEYAEKNHQVWDNSNIQESYCGATTPLTFAFARSAYSLVYQQTMEVLKFSDRKKVEFAPYMDNLLGIVHGQIYYNIRNWHRGLLLFPSFKVKKDDMEKMMGVTESVEFIEDRKLQFSAKLREFPGAIMAAANLMLNFIRLPSLVKVFNRNFKEELEQFWRLHLFEMEAVEIHKTLNHFKKSVLREWHTPIINDFHVMMSNGRVVRFLKKAGLEDRQEDVASILATGDDLASIRPTKELLNIAWKIKTLAPEALELIKTSDASTCFAFFEQDHQKIYIQILKWIDDFGDRTIGELKLETITPRQNPELIFTFLKPMLNLEKNHFAHKMQSDPIDQLLQGTKPILRKKLANAINKLRRAIATREELRFARTKVFGVVRACYSEIGVRLVASKIINDARDIFYLSENEIDDLFCGCIPDKTLVGVIDIRKAEHKRQLGLEPSGHIRTWGIPIHAIPSSPIGSNTKSQLVGIGCSAGVVTGEVQKVIALSADWDLEGKILCATRTDPGWAPLFPLVKGVLVEKGSTLSHSAIIARELGIPTVVGIKHLMESTYNGQILTLNGTTGEVALHDEAKAV
jgi:rifampicin phosphotransferase